MYDMDLVLGAYAQRTAELGRSRNRLAQGVAWVEGGFHPLSQARIPILDQGFLRSDLTYDVPAVWDGRYFRLDDHLDRLQASCEKMRLRIPLPRESLRATLVDMSVLDVFFLAPFCAQTLR